MKTPILKPGFEFIFALSLMAILGLPPMLMAQNTKDVEIKIVNGDTTVNGKHIKDLTPDERKMAMRDIKHISADDAGANSKNHIMLFTHRDTTGRKMMTENIFIKRDSMGNPMPVRQGGRRPRHFTIKRDNDDRMIQMEGNRNDAMLGTEEMHAEAKNSQSFHYINIDNNGISTHLSFHVSEVTNEDLKRMPHIEGARLTISDLNIVPEFAAGKILLMFALPSKGIAEVKLVDGSGTTLWTEKASGGKFSKSFVMGLNGIYYLEVKQGNGIAVKRILKDE
jgi:hypothetical protein